jgi:hypothetical protein
MTASARIQAELDDFADLTRAAQELLSVVDSLETVQKLQPLLRVEDRSDGDALDLGSSLADEPSETSAEPVDLSADDVMWHERCRAEWSGMPAIEARTGWEQVYTDAALHQTIFGDGESAVAHPFVLLNVGRADFSGHPLMTDAALARLLDCCPALRSVDVTGCALNVGLAERALAARGFVYSPEAGDGLVFVRDSG